ncbi:sensor histidine kinase [Nocardioides sp.]|uniref:sensor histidine kinase n=1 Tax=Nocardioides sp. TaxID=35761 RepID=UPI003513AC94
MLRSLSSRLIATAVLLVVVVTVLIGAATTIAMRSYLTDQLDEKVLSSVTRIGRPPPDGDDPRVPDGPGAAEYPAADPTRLEGPVNLGAGTLVALPELGDGRILSERRFEGEQLSAAALATLARVPADGRVHEVGLDGLPDYRVAATRTDTGQLLVSGLPTDDVDDAVTSLIAVEAVLALLALAVAGVAGRWVVRRQLRPLTEVAHTAHTVATLPLDSGEIGVTDRVPASLTDERTEVGQVGAALNRLLAHVESSLAARHASEQRVRQFVADASHELRTPLTTIAGYAELARRRPDDSGAAALALSKVEEESARMTALVEDLLLLARLDSGRPLEQAPVDLSLLLIETVSDARVLAPDHRWRLDLPEDAVEVTGDADRLRQVVTNLLTNARKYTPAGTTVTVTADAGGFSVHDDGPGFPSDLVPVAFERFARGDAARHREGGVGLGLSLVAAIVAAHGGRVTLSSVPGDTRIRVDLG